MPDARRFSPSHLLLKFACACGVGLSGCGAPRVPLIPEPARDQTPLSAAPQHAWAAHGRFIITLPNRRFSGDMHIRRTETQELHVVAIADGGLTLFSGTITDTKRTIVSCIDDLRDYADYLLSPTAAWMVPSDGTWQRDHQLLTYKHDDRQFIYGGDPIALRRIEQAGWPTWVGNYRLVDGQLIAHSVIGEGPFGIHIEWLITHWPTRTPSVPY